MAASTTLSYSLHVVPIEKTFDENNRTLTVKAKLHKTSTEKYKFTPSDANDANIAKAIVQQWRRNLAHKRPNIKQQLDQSFSPDPYSPIKGASPWKVQSVKAVGKFAQLTLVAKNNMPLKGLRPQGTSWSGFLESLMSLEDADDGISTWIPIPTCLKYKVNDEQTNT
jgi:hypothetical protein